MRFPVHVLKPGDPTREGALLGTEDLTLKSGATIRVELRAEVGSGLWYVYSEDAEHPYRSCAETLAAARASMVDYIAKTAPHPTPTEHVQVCATSRFWHRPDVRGHSMESMRADFVLDLHAFQRVASATRTHRRETFEGPPRALAEFPQRDHVSLYERDMQGTDAASVYEIESLRWAKTVVQVAHDFFEALTQRLGAPHGELLRREGLRMELVLPADADFRAPPAAADTTRRTHRRP